MINIFWQPVAADGYDKGGNSWRRQEYYAFSDFCCKYMKILTR